MNANVSAARRPQRQAWLALVAASTLVNAVPVAAAPPRIEAELTYAPQVPAPISRHHPAIVVVPLRTTHRLLSLTTRQQYPFWTFNDHVPGPFIRVRAGDWLEVQITNTDTTGMPHNVDFHAATGPGGGAPLLTVAPGEHHRAWLRLRDPGLFVYHCAVPPMIDHIANGMFGLILVEPTNGLPAAQREFYIMQSEVYATNGPPGTRQLQYSHADAMAEQPQFVVFNGASGAMLFRDALRAQTGDRVRLFFGNAGPDLLSSFHVIGTVLRRVYRNGSLQNPPQRGLQTVLVSPGAATVIEFRPTVPGSYDFLDHDAAHSEKGAMGQLEVSGPRAADVYRSEQDGPPTE